MISFTKFISCLFSMLLPIFCYPAAHKDPRIKYLVLEEPSKNPVPVPSKEKVPLGKKESPTKLKKFYAVPDEILARRQNTKTP